MGMISSPMNCNMLLRKRQVHFNILEDSADDDLNDDRQVIAQELKELMEAKDVGIAYMMGHSHVKAKRSSSWLKTIAIDFVYAFLHRNCREPSMALHIPHMSLIEVGMVYYV